MTIKGNNFHIYITSRKSSGYPVPSSVKAGAGCVGAWQEVGKLTSLAPPARLSLVSDIVEVRKDNAMAR